MEEEDLNIFSGIFPPQPWELRSTASQESVPRFREGQTPRVPTAVVSQLSTPAESPIATPERVRPRRRNVATRPKLQLLRLEEWDKDRAYNEDPPTCLRYTIEWSAMLNEKEFVRDTEPNLALNPAAYWQLCLQRRVEGLVQKKLGDDSIHKLDHTVVVASLSGRSEPKLNKHFEAAVDWQCVEKHLTQWSDHFQSGTKLRVDITFHYLESGQEPIASSSKRGAIQQGTKRGASSATQRMRTRLSNQLNAEQASDAETWSDVYRVMRCPMHAPKDHTAWWIQSPKKHRKLFPHHLEVLILQKSKST